MRTEKKISRVAGVVLVTAFIVGSTVGVGQASVSRATGVKLNRSKVTLSVSEKMTLRVSGTKAKVIWKSSDSKVATISKKGKIVAKKVGKATITAKVAKKTLKCRVTVREAKPVDETPANEPGTYKQITQIEAMKMMAKKDDGHVIVDVRRQDEYDEGHIPGAILVPNESIGTEKPELLPDTHQIILIYCRSGRRSKEASQKLADIGYDRVFEFGGIIDWPGAIIKSEEV